MSTLSCAVTRVRSCPLSAEREERSGSGGRYRESRDTGCGLFLLRTLGICLWYVLSLSCTSAASPVPAVAATVYMYMLIRAPMIHTHLQVARSVVSSQKTVRLLRSPARWWSPCGPRRIEFVNHTLAGDATITYHATFSKDTLLRIACGCKCQRRLCSRV